MKLGFVTAILPELTLEEVLDVAVYSNVAAVALQCTWSK